METDDNIKFHLSPELPQNSDTWNGRTFSKWMTLRSNMVSIHLPLIGPPGLMLGSDNQSRKWT